MRLFHPPPHLAPFGLRALKDLATSDGPVSSAASNILADAQRILLGTSLSLADLPSITPEELASHIVDPALRRQLVIGMVALSMADGLPSAERLRRLEAFAVGLGVAASELDSTRLLANKHLLLFRLDFFRRTHIAHMLVDSVERAGLLPTLKGVLGMRGLHEEPALAARYRDLARLPAGTLGRSYIDYIDRNGFRVPGEKGGFPEGGVFHDLGHVMTGYDTDPHGELCMGGFQAGYMKHEPVFMLLFGIVTFGAGINVTPVPQPYAGGVFDTPGIMAHVLSAIDQGARLKLDLSDRWDYWPLIERPIAEVTEAIGLTPAT